MAKLKEKLREQIPVMRDEIKSMIKTHGDKIVSQVTFAQAYGGMRGVKGLICDTSDVPPEKGLIIRGYPVAEVANKLSEEIFYLLCTGELPDKEGIKDIKEEFKNRSEVPGYVWKILKSLPEDAHPMAMFNTAVLALERESIFRDKYTKGMRKEEYWDATLEDCLNLLAKLPAIAAAIYRMKFKKAPRIKGRSKLDWAANYAHMMGVEDTTGEFANLMRLYMVLHSDHEGGNVSAHSCHCIGSALSDPYYAISGGLNGLAGPLHGLANQECLGWILMVRDKFGGVPSDDQLRQFAWDTLNSGKVIPGYGHAVLRITDPRYEAFRTFGRRVCPDDPIFQLVEKVFNIIPNVLTEHGKAKNPWPNVDAASGSLLHYFGVKEFEYYTVLFGVSRALGMCAQLVVSRAWGESIERPKSVTTNWMKNNIAK